MNKQSIIASAALVLISCQTAIGQVKTKLAHRQKYYVLDSRVIASTENAKLEVGKVTKHKANPLFVEDKAWEMRYDNLYGNIIYDQREKIYKCWYSPFIIDAEWDRKMTVEQRNKKRYRSGRREMGICYATSKDGIKWEKPELGLMNYDPKNRHKRDSGDKRNNIVLRGPHGAGVFRDDRDPDAKRRYKTIYQGLYTSVSPDGLHWSKPAKCKGVRVAGDTHNNAFWAPTLKKYVGITRSWGRPHGRQVARIESDDFVNWTKEVVVLEGTNKQQTYAMPVFFRHNVYFGLIAIFDIPSNRVWTELAWSADTKKWNRVSPGTPLIPCSEKKLDYDYGCVYPCAYPVFLKDEIRLYYGGSDYLHNGWRTGSLCLATLRPDGFAGYEPVDKNKPATVTTQLVPWNDKCLMISADAKGGSVVIEVLDDKGKLIATAKTINGAVSGKIAEFPKDVTIKQDQPVRLRFKLTGAKLYSFGFPLNNAAVRF
ncbi:MAG: hypothetical protein QGG42_10850 [Phycisphaerae bacterium]|nr:hypothetical protein [Phycisphaerae bacterium]